MTESFKTTLTAILALLHEREDIKSANPTVKVRPLIREDSAETEAKCNTLRGKMAIEATRVDAISATIYHAVTGAPTLQQKCHQASSSIVAAKVQVVRIEAELARA